MTILLAWMGCLISTGLYANGWITMHCSVAGVNIMVDEEEYKVKDKYKCIGLNEGLHLVIVEKEGYRPYTDTVTVTDGTNHMMNVWLEPLSEQAQKRSGKYASTLWEYEIRNGRFQVRWAGLGGGVGTGLNLHVSLFQLRYGMLTLDPCLWGSKLPFFSGLSHVSIPWRVHPRDRRSEIQQYQVAVPSQDVQFYYSPMAGVLFPLNGEVAFVLNAGPQISWTRVYWAHQYRDLPSSYPYVFTEEEFPKTGYQFDPVWFSAQFGTLFTGRRSDLFLYLKYQDGYFGGIEFRF